MRLIQAAILALVLGTVSVRADSIVFSPTGSGQAYTISAIDLAVGNSLAVNSLPFSIGKTFQLDYQASIAALIGTNGLPFTPAGLASSYQLTAVGSFTEVVQSFAPGVVTFALAPTQSSSSFFELYQNTAVVADNLAGTGFNIGTRILAGTPATALPSIGIYSTALSNGQPTIVPFDRFISNNYPGITTVAGSGSFLLSVNVSSFNPAYFHTPIDTLTFNSSLVSPFEQQNPSALFVGSPGGGLPTVVPNIGTINGVNGPDLQSQADGNFTMHTSSGLFRGPSSPEPSSIVLIMIGLLGVLVCTRLKRG